VQRSKSEGEEGQYFCNTRLALLNKSETQRLLRRSIDQTLPSSYNYEKDGQCSENERNRKGVTIREKQGKVVMKKKKTGEEESISVLITRMSPPAEFL
jgi:hypothetical protein